MEEWNWIVEGASFVIMIALSLIVRLYYGCVQGEQNTVSEHLLDDKHMSVFRIAMSLITSQISGITLLGNPSEIYSYGTQYLISAGIYVLSSFIIIYIYLPVFYELQATSVFEYLDHRFSSNVHKVSSITNVISVVIYLPAMALGHITGLNLHYITPVICSICILYTTIGGLKTVVWTDAIQGIFTTALIIIVIVLGLIRVGGFNNMFKVNLERDRIEFFGMDPDLFLRNTFWTVTIGMMFNIIKYMGIQAGSDQRFVALPTFKKAQNSLILFSLVIKVLTDMTGLLIYATYKDCDSSLANYIKSDKNIVTYFVADVASKILGTGLFISVVVSVALSTMLAQLNTLSGTIYEDLIVKTLNVRPSDLTASFIMKCTVVVIEIICMILVFAIEKLNGIIQGVMCSMLTSIGVMASIVSGAQMALINNELKFVKKNVSIAACPDGLHFKNYSDFSGLYRMNEDVYVSPNVNKLFAVSYMHYSTIGTIIALVVGIIVSLMFPTEQNIDPKLLTPCIRN